MTARIAGPPAPNWAKWRLMPKVQIWQAAALSLNICPNWMRLLDRQSGGELRQLLNESGLSPEQQVQEVDRWIDLAQQVKDRCDIISANGEEMEARQNDQHPDHATISLQRFLLWVVRAGWEIPDGLKVISSVASPAVIAQGEPQPKRRNANPRDDLEFREWALSEAKKRGGVAPSREEMIGWYEQRNIARAHARKQIKMLPPSIRQKAGKAGRV